MEMEKTSTYKVALVTGANAGVGFALCQRLLQRFPEMKLCLCCRNKGNAEIAASKLQKENPKAEITFVLLDTSSIDSVYRAAVEIRNKYDHIDYLYLNAGTFKVLGVDWAYFFKKFFSSELPRMLTTGENLLLHEDDQTEDGLRRVFETNLFGHYALVQELDQLLERASETNERPGQIIWTSSRNGMKHNFNLDDIQHEKGKEPYSSSKYAMNLTSAGLNERMNSKGVYSHIASPGLMNTKLVQGTLPSWVWIVFLPFIFLMRLFVPSLTSSPENGSIALFWVSQQDPASLSPYNLFGSCCDIWGSSYVKQEKMDVAIEDAENLLKQLDSLNTSFKTSRLKTGL